MILKMNFNFNFKDMPFAPGPSMCDLTNGSDLHHAEKYGIKRASQQPPGVMVPICRNGGEGHHSAEALLWTPLQETSRIELDFVATETHQNLGDTSISGSVPLPKPS
jgi:hypothetical protein